MRPGTQLVAHLLATACGLLMVAAVGVGTYGPARAVAVSALVAVAAAILFRPVATLAVLLTAAVIALTGPAATVAAVAGLSAAVYLVLRHGAASGYRPRLGERDDAGLGPGVHACGPGRDRFTLQLPWLPLLAPLAVFAITCWPPGHF